MVNKKPGQLPGRVEVWMMDVTDAQLAKSRSRTLMAAKNFARLMAEFEGNPNYCAEAMSELLDAADQLQALEDYRAMVTDPSTHSAPPAPPA